MPVTPARCVMQLGQYNVEKLNFNQETSKYLETKDNMCPLV